MTDANRILEAAKATPIASRLDAEDDVRPVVVAVLRELGKSRNVWHFTELYVLAEEIEEQ